MSKQEFSSHQKMNNINVIAFPAACYIKPQNQDIEMNNMVFSSPLSSCCSHKTITDCVHGAGNRTTIYCACLVI
jgi:hypothetical protein